MTHRHAMTQDVPRQKENAPIAPECSVLLSILSAFRTVLKTAPFNSLWYFSRHSTIASVDCARIAGAGRGFSSSKRPSLSAAARLSLPPPCAVAVAGSVPSRTAMSCSNCLQKAHNNKMQANSQTTNH